MLRALNRTSNVKYNILFFEYYSKSNVSECLIHNYPGQSIKGRRPFYSVKAKPMAFVFLTFALSCVLLQSNKTTKV